MEELRVVRWASYDDYSIEAGKVTDNIFDVVISDVKKNGYLFTGEHHQEYPNCAPVLSDGKIYRFCRRAFAGIMAFAHGESEPYAYARYMEMAFVKPGALKFPK